MRPVQGVRRRHDGLPVLLHGTGHALAGRLHGGQEGGRRDERDHGGHDPNDGEEGERREGEVSEVSLLNAMRDYTTINLNEFKS